MAIANLIDENKLKPTHTEAPDRCPQAAPLSKPKSGSSVPLTTSYNAKLAACSLFDSVVVDLPACLELRAQGVDLHSVTRITGPIVLVQATFGSDCRVKGDDYGEVAFAMAVHSEDPTDVIDLVAWSARQPDVFGVMFGAGILGLDQLLNPASYVHGPCMLHDHPLDWLKADCRGAVVLQYDAAQRALQKAPGPLTAASKALADELVGQSVLPSSRLRVPSSWRAIA